MSKSLFKTKTFWFNLAAMAVEVVQVIPGVPPGTLTLITAIGNIVLRRATDTPTHIVSPRYR